jgi:hypothetical protein
VTCSITPRCPPADGNGTKITRLTTAYQHSPNWGLDKVTPREAATIRSQAKRHSGSESHVIAKERAYWAGVLLGWPD